jgi:metal-dependent amidase/aminoacylase/carboxypeptidase family protein
MSGGVRRLQARPQKVSDESANDCRAEYIAAPVLRPAVDNDPALSALAERAVEKVCPGAVVEQEPWMASESFSWYQAEFGGVFAFVGMQNPEVGSGALHHNGKFDVDESCMIYGASATVQFAADYLLQE